MPLVPQSGAPRVKSPRSKVQIWKVLLFEVHIGREQKNSLKFLYGKSMINFGP